MHLRQLNLDQRPGIITDRIIAMSNRMRLRRRAIITAKNDGLWSVPLVVLQGFPNSETPPDVFESVAFDRLILDETWLSPKEVLDFLDTLDRRELSIGPAIVDLGERAHWSLEHFSTNDSPTSGPGCMAELRLPDDRNLPDGAFLNVARNIYLPNADAAIRYWAPFSPCHGLSDGRLGALHIFLPEERAFFVNVLRRDNGLEITLRGSQLNSGVHLTAAIAAGGRIDNISRRIDGAEAAITLPSDCDWWDLLLYTTEGEFLDQWTSRELSHTDAGDDGSTIKSLVRAALDSGEGPRIEFKPLLALPQNRRGTKWTDAARGKFAEILRTVAAMANADGGDIFLGISDNLELDRCAVALRQWAEGDIDDSAIDRYRKALHTHLKDRLVTKAAITTYANFVEGAPIVMIRVSPNTDGDVTAIEDDPAFYVRRGASNRRVSPSDWPRLVRPFAQPYHNS